MQQFGKKTIELQGLTLAAWVVIQLSVSDPSVIPNFPIKAPKQIWQFAEQQSGMGDQMTSTQLPCHVRYHGELWDNRSN